MKTRWTCAEAAKHIDAWSASGKSVEAFAAEHELFVQRLRYWQKRLTARAAQSTQQRPAPGLLPGRVTPVVPAHASSVLGPGCVIRVSRGFDEEPAREGTVRKRLMLGLPPSVVRVWSGPSVTKHERPGISAASRAEVLGGGKSIASRVGEGRGALEGQRG